MCLPEEEEKATAVQRLVCHYVPQMGACQPKRASGMA